MADLTLTFRTLGAPVQIDGVTGDGRTVYYRERHNRWRVEVDGEEIAAGARGINWTMAEHVYTLMGALWHPYMSDQFNAREDAQDEAARRVGP